MTCKKLKVVRADGQFRWLLYDEADAAAIEARTWSLEVQSGTAYVRTAVYTDGVPLHQTAGQLLLGFGPWGEGRVEYINGNGMDVRRRNLRHASQAQVLAKRRPVGGASIYKGVSWDKERKRWVATFRRAKVGRYKDEQDAALAFDRAAFTQWGFRAYLNFPDHPQLLAFDTVHLCLRCRAMTESPTPDRCGRCTDWPDYDVTNPTMGDFARLAEHLHGQGGWTAVAAGLADALSAADLISARGGISSQD